MVLVEGDGLVSWRTFVKQQEECDDVACWVEEMLDEAKKVCLLEKGDVVYSSTLTSLGSGAKVNVS